jgi:hypothetical protein
MKNRTRLKRKNGWDLVKIYQRHMSSSNQIFTRVPKISNENFGRKYFHKLKKNKNSLTVSNG